MVRRYAVVTTVKIKCHRTNRRKMGLGRIHAGSHCRKYRYYKTVTAGGPTLADADCLVPCRAMRSASSSCRASTCPCWCWAGEGTA